MKKQGIFREYIFRAKFEVDVLEMSFVFGVELALFWCKTCSEIVQWIENDLNQ